MNTESVRPMATVKPNTTKLQMHRDTPQCSPIKIKAPILDLSVIWVKKLNINVDVMLLCLPPTQFYCLPSMCASHWVITLRPFYPDTEDTFLCKLRKKRTLLSMQLPSDHFGSTGHRRGVGFLLHIFKKDKASKYCSKRSLTLTSQRWPVPSMKLFSWMFLNPREEAATSSIVTSREQDGWF